MMYFIVNITYNDNKDNNNVPYLFLFKINMIFSGPMSMTKIAFIVPGITY